MKTDPGIKSQVIVQLMHEHVQIKQVLAVLRAVGKRVERRTQVPYEDLRLLVRFFQEYADKIHHYGEEELIFPKVEKSAHRDLARLAGKLGSQHVMGRILVSGMADAVADSKTNRRGWRQQFCGDATALFTLLSIHICDEDHVFFPMADAVLSRQKGVAVPEMDIAAKRRRWEAQVRRLMAKYEIASGDAKQCGCGDKVCD